MEEQAGVVIEDKIKLDTKKLKSDTVGAASSCLLFREITLGNLFVIWGIAYVRSR